jgi:hypothetical protein
MSGHVRVGEDDRVLEICLDKLYKQDIWWLVVYFDGSEVRYTYFPSSAHVESLAKFVRELIEDNIPHLVFAIWHGKRRTDAFLVDSQKIVERFGV